LSLRRITTTALTTILLLLLLLLLYHHQVDHIPGAMRSNYSVAAFFENLFPNCIKKVTIMLEAEELDTLWGKYQKTCDWLEWANAVTTDRKKLRCGRCRSQERLLKKIQKMLDKKEVRGGGGGGSSSRGRLVEEAFLLVCSLSKSLTPPSSLLPGIGACDSEDTEGVYRMALSA